MSLSNKMAKAAMWEGDMPTLGPPASPWAPGNRITRYAGPMVNVGDMGDPGLFGDIWKGIKSVGRVATGVVGGLGIPFVSGAARFAGSTVFGRGQPPVLLPGGARMIPSMQGPMPYQTPGIAGAAQRFFPGGATGFQAPPPTGSMGGYHLNKTGYWLKDGTYIAPGTKWVKNRRRNPGNMKALSRSLGRIKSAKRMTKALSAVSIRKSCPA